MKENFCNLISFSQQAAAISRFWKNHKAKIHDVVMQRSSFGNTLKQTNWRIDLKTHSRHLEQINTPVAIYELEVGKNDSKNVCIFYSF